jgi:hypothetical protein
MGRNLREYFQLSITLSQFKLTQPGLSSSEWILVGLLKIHRSVIDNDDTAVLNESASGANLLGG